MANTNIKETLKSLQSLYEKGDYAGGIDLLLTHKDELPKSTFHYNFGTLYLKKGELPIARYHLEMALRSGRADSKVLHNLQSTKEKLDISQVESSVSLKDQLLMRGMEWPFDAYAFITLLFLLMVGLLFKLKRVIKVPLLILLVVVSLVPVIFKMAYFDQNSFAINLQAQPVYSGPSKVHETTGQMPVGVKLILGKSFEGWHFVESPKQFQGWIPKESIILYK